MAAPGPNAVRTGVIWSAVLTAGITPIAAAAMSPLLAWRDPVYITGGFAGILALALLLIQPLLAAGLLPAVSLQSARRVHRRVGVTLVVAVLVHVVALWITSPPDMIDAMLLASPTPFSIWGVLAMWALFAAAALAALRRRLPLRPVTWRAAHGSLAALVVITGVAHSVLIEGTMERVTKIGLCALVICAMAAALLRIWTRGRGPRRAQKLDEG